MFIFVNNENFKKFMITPRLEKFYRAVRKFLLSAKNNEKVENREKN